MEPVFENSREGLTVGSDKVVFFDGSIVVYAARAMADWQVREYCRIPVFFQDRKYYIRRKARAEAPYVMGYELAPWPEDLHEESSLSITYDQEYVARRDRFLQQDKLDDFGRLLLLPCFPLLGFLWSGFKDRRLERFGFDPVSMTSASLLVEFAIFLIETVFLLVLPIHVGFAQVVFGLETPWFDCTLLVMVLADMVARYDQVLRGVEIPAGFLEWLLKSRPAAKSRPTTSGRRLNEK
jgi:hypothetical protein